MITKIADEPDIGEYLSPLSRLPNCETFILTGFAVSSGGSLGNRLILYRTLIGFADSLTTMKSVEYEHAVSVKAKSVREIRYM